MNKQTNNQFGRLFFQAFFSLPLLSHHFVFTRCYMIYSAEASLFFSLCQTDHSSSTAGLRLGVPRLHARDGMTTKSLTFLLTVTGAGCYSSRVLPFPRFSKTSPQRSHEVILERTSTEAPSKCKATPQQ